MIIKNNDTLKYKIIHSKDGLKNWYYLPFSSSDSSTVDFLGIKALEQIGPIMMEHPDYSQTEIVLFEYNRDYKTHDKELTGVI